MIVKTVRMGVHSVLTYKYSVGGVGFKFHLLSEVGEPYQKAARGLRDALARKRKCEVVTMELEAAPWFVEALVKQKLTTKELK